VELTRPFPLPRWRSGRGFLKLPKYLKFRSDSTTLRPVPEKASLNTNYFLLAFLLLLIAQTTHEQSCNIQLVYLVSSNSCSTTSPLLVSASAFVFALGLFCSCAVLSLQLSKCIGHKLSCLPLIEFNSTLHVNTQHRKLHCPFEGNARVDSFDADAKRYLSEIRPRKRLPPQTQQSLIGQSQTKERCFAGPIAAFARRQRSERYAYSNSSYDGRAPYYQTN
jgi:hypothetical protein